ncbi:uncharacterized protein O3C94_019765 isoform 1-T4 [Discoglossus pictus]
MDRWEMVASMEDKVDLVLIDNKGVPYTFKNSNGDSHLNPSKDTSGGKKCTGKADKKVYRYDKQDKPFKCSTCGKPYRWPSHLRHHQKTHNDERPHTCPVCQKGFKDIHKLARHQKIHPEFQKDMVYWKLYKCHICDRPFKYPSDLDKHHLIHSGEKPFKCPICGAGFRRLDHLKRHNFVHTGNRPFKCGVCGKGFVEATELLKHERIHTGEKPYQCNICDKSFYHPRSLKEHEGAKHGVVRQEKTSLREDSHCTISTTKEQVDQCLVSGTSLKSGRDKLDQSEYIPKENSQNEIVIYLSDDEH